MSKPDYKYIPSMEDNRLFLISSDYLDNKNKRIPYKQQIITVPDSEIEKLQQYNSEKTNGILVKNEKEPVNAILIEQLHKQIIKGKDIKQYREYCLQDRPIKGFIEINILDNIKNEDEILSSFLKMLFRYYKMKNVNININNISIIEIHMNHQISEKFLGNCTIFRIIFTHLNYFYETLKELKKDILQFKNMLQTLKSKYPESKDIKNMFNSIKYSKKDIFDDSIINDNIYEDGNLFSIVPIEYDGEKFSDVFELEVKRFGKHINDNKNDYDFNGENLKVFKTLLLQYLNPKQLIKIAHNPNILDNFEENLFSKKDLYDSMKIEKTLEINSDDEPKKRKNKEEISDDSDQSDSDSELSSNDDNETDYTMKDFQGNEAITKTKKIKFKKRMVSDDNSKKLYNQSKSTKQKKLKISNTKQSKITTIEEKGQYKRKKREIENKNNIKSINQINYEKLIYKFINEYLGEGIKNNSYILNGGELKNNVETFYPNQKIINYANTSGKVASTHLYICYSI